MLNLSFNHYSYFCYSEVSVNGKGQENNALGCGGKQAAYTKEYTSDAYTVMLQTNVCEIIHGEAGTVAVYKVEGLAHY